MRFWKSDGTPGAILETDWTSWCWSPDSTSITCVDGHSIQTFDANSGDPVWVNVLGTTFTASGRLLKPVFLDDTFVYTVKKSTGQLELLKPSEFQKRIANLTGSNPER